MIVKRMALVSSVITIILVGVILVLGNGRGPAWAFEPSTDAFAWAMFISSALLAYVLISSGHRRLGAVFAANLIVSSTAAGGFAAAGVALPITLLFVADVVWLILYVAALTKHWTLFVR
jgi:hypothetical protein